MRTSLLLCCSILFSVAEAQVVNGSFENGTTGWIVPCECAPAYGTTVVPGGTGSLSLGLENVHTDCGCMVFNAVHQFTPWVIPGTWKLSGWIKSAVPNDVPGSRVTVTAGMPFFTPAMASIWSSAGAWEYVETTFQVSEQVNLDSLRIAFVPDDGNQQPATLCYFDDIRLTFVLPGGGVNLRMKAALDGALPSGTLMSDALRAANLIPTTQPYTALGYTFVGPPSGATTTTPSMLAVTGDNAIVDWVFVELRSSPSTVVCSRVALLQRDGDVVDTDGDPWLNFQMPVGNYYVALRHRNHLGVMTSTTRALTGDPTANMIDFRSGFTAAYGSNARAQKGQVLCLWAGDATGNGTLKYTGTGNDRDPILTAVGSTTPNNTLSNVYDRRDTNLDGVIKYTGTANDRDIILINVGSTTPNNTRIQQLP